jgi:hypothetical protein
MPTSIVDNITNRTTRNPEHSPKNTLIGNLPRVIQVANFLYFLIGEFCHWVVLIFSPVIENGSTFRDHVMGVVCLSSNKKVSGITTSAVVTLMTNYKSLWYGTVSHFVNYTMCAKNFAVVGDFSIPATACSGVPLPTIIRAAFVYPAPKTFFKRLLHLISVKRNRQPLLPESVTCQGWASGIQIL